MQFRQSLFWDTDPTTIDPDRHATYIIERIMDFGFDEEVRWMFRRYTNTQIKQVFETSRVLQPSTRSLWNLYFN